MFYTLRAKDPDVNDTTALKFTAAEPMTAVDKNGKQITENESFKVRWDCDRFKNINYITDFRADV